LIGVPYQAEYDLDEAEHERATSQAELAKNDAERAKRLIATKAISEEDFDTKTRTYTSALAAVKSAKATLDVARLHLGFTEIRAPIDGSTHPNSAIPAFNFSRAFADIFRGLYFASLICDRRILRSYIHQIPRVKRNGPHLLRAFFRFPTFSRKNTRMLFN
jgi:hypothetical protein